MTNWTDTGVDLDADPEIPLALLLVLRLDVYLLHLRVENLDVVQLQPRVGSRRAGRRRAVQIIHRSIALPANTLVVERASLVAPRICRSQVVTRREKTRRRSRVRDTCDASRFAYLARAHTSHTHTHTQHATHTRSRVGLRWPCAAIGRHAAVLNPTLRSVLATTCWRKVCDSLHVLSFVSFFFFFLISRTHLFPLSDRGRDDGYYYRVRESTWGRCITGRITLDP